MAARDKEMAEAARLFQLAMVAIGARVTEDTLQLWAQVPVTRKTPPRAWFQEVVDTVETHRATTRALASAYYRLVRALATGRTVVDLPGGDHSPPTLNGLRGNFREELRPHLPVSTLNASRLTKPSVAGAVIDGKALMPDDEIPVDPLDGRDEELRSDNDDVMSRFEHVTPRVVDLRERMQGIDEDQPGTKVDAERQEIFDKVGGQMVRAAEWLSLEAGRNVVARNIEHDEQALGWMRISTTGHPCDFCAMLMTRGLVRDAGNKGSAMPFSEIGANAEFHTNCHCVAIPIFSPEFLRDSPLFDLNRFFAHRWSEVTEGLSGDDARRAWRDWIRKFNKGVRETPSTTRSTREVDDVQAA